MKRENWNNGVSKLDLNQLVSYCLPGGVSIRINTRSNRREWCKVGTNGKCSAAVTFQMLSELKFGLTTNPVIPTFWLNKYASKYICYMFKISVISCCKTSSWKAQNISNSTLGCLVSLLHFDIFYSRKLVSLPNFEIGNSLVLVRTQVLSHTEMFPFLRCTRELQQQEREVTNINGKNNINIADKYNYI